MPGALITSFVFLAPLFLLYVLGVPVGIAMVLASVVGMLGFGNLNYSVISSQLLSGLDSFPLLAVPFYVYLGRLMNSIGLTSRIFRFAASIVGQFRGGIAYVNVVASMFFAGMSGLATADVAGLGRIEYKAMREYGYDKATAIGVTGSSSLIGPIIPPSVPMIVYALLAGQSTGALFLAGILPGILWGVSLMCFIFLAAWWRGYEPLRSFNIQEVVSSFRAAFFPLLTPIIIIGGILGGWVTATEAGAIGVVYTIILGYFLGESFDTNILIRETRDSMIETAALTFLLAAASLYGLVAIQLGIPALLTESIIGFSTNPTIVILLMFGLFLIVGSFMGAVASITVLTPILIPVVNSVGIDPIHFGVVMVATLLFGQLTPPFGTILFVLEKVTDATVEEIVKSVLPFYIPMLVVLLIIILIPSISLFVPYELLG